LIHELGLDWVTTHAEAEKMTYRLSEVVLERLYEHLGRPTVCPHANELPGAGPPKRNLTRLGCPARSWHGSRS